MASHMHRHLANVLTAARVALTPAFVLLVLRESGGWQGWLAVCVFAMVAASDVVDGQLARRAGTASHGGRIFDHVADIGFILAALGAYVAIGVAPWWVPGSIGLAFGTYAVTSWVAPGPGASRGGARIGHLGGIANFVVVGVLVLNHSANLQWLGTEALYAVFALVPLYSGLAVAASLGAAFSSVRRTDLRISVE